MFQPLCIRCLVRDPVEWSMLCGGCFARMRGDLATVEWAHGWLDEAMTSLRSGWREGSIHAATTESHPPFELEMLDVRARIVDFLRTWARLAGEEYTPAIAGPAAADVESVTTWLFELLPWISHRPWCDDFAAGLADLRSQAYSLAPWEACRRDLSAPCGRCRQLTLSRYGSDDSVICRNRECGRVLTAGEYELLVVQWDQLMVILDIEPVLPLGSDPFDPDNPALVFLSTEMAAAAAHVPERTIRTWAARGKITSITKEGSPPAYRESDVLRAETATRRRKRGRQLREQAQAEKTLPP